MLLPQIFKANDIRGIVGSQWDERGAHALGRAYATLVGAPTVVVSRDMRVTSPAIHAAFVDAVTEGGVSVVDIGLASTDGLWFAAGRLNLPAAQVTSSHNPAEYNGLKFCLPGAKPVSQAFLRDLAEAALAIDDGTASPAPAAVRGTVETRDLLPDYAQYLRSLVDCTGWRRLKVVVDAGNGMAGYTAPAVLAPLNVEIIGLYLELDGTFPHHQPNPLDPANLVDAQRAVTEHGADLALVFDGDADRVFLIDERGEVVSPSAVTAMIAVAELAREPGATTVINTITSSAVREIVEPLGGRIAESRVGHTYMKALMATTGAVFGGEHSAHYYFRDFFGADTGLLAALHVLAAVGRADQPLSALVAQYDRYPASGEINSVVAEPEACMRRVAAAFEDRAAAHWGDGVKLIGDGWWISLRPSNTEPLLRLNVEGRTADQVARLRDDVLHLIKEV